MTERIIYEKDDGTLAVVIPAPDCGLTIEQIAAKDVPAGKSYEIVDVSAIPTDRTFRNAWRKVGATVEVSMPPAREIHRDHIREARDPLLAELDVKYMKALEQGQDTTAIVAQKQALRDAPQDPRIDAAQTPQELKAVWPIPSS